MPAPPKRKSRPSSAAISSNANDVFLPDLSSTPGVRCEPQDVACLVRRRRHGLREDRGEGRRHSDRDHSASRRRRRRRSDRRDRADKRHRSEVEDRLGTGREDADRNRLAGAAGRSHRPARYEGSAHGRRAIEGRPRRVEIELRRRIGGTEAPTAAVQRSHHHAPRP